MKNNIDKNRVCIFLVTLLCSIYNPVLAVVGTHVKTEHVQVGLNKSKLITLDKNIKIEEISQGNTAISNNNFKTEFNLLSSNPPIRPKLISNVISFLISSNNLLISLFLFFEII